MSAVFVNLTLMMVLLLASTGGTLAAAAGSLPDSPLYPVKLAVEQVQVDLLADPEQIAAKHLELAYNRLQEILHLASQGLPVQENSSFRLQEHFNFALQYTAQLGEAQMAGMLTRAQHLLQNQLQEMEQVRSQLRVRQQDPLGEPLRILQQTQARVQAGLEDPLAFRQQARYGFSDTARNPGCPQGDCLPNYHFHLRRGYPQLKSNRTRAGYTDPASEDVSQPENLIGEQECGTCLPIGEENHYGQDPSGEQGYGAGQPGGNPEPDCDDCIPSGDEHKYGQQPDQPGDGKPGGNPDCSQQECEPEGDHHQEGQPPDSDQGSGSGSSDQGSTGSSGNDSSGNGSEGSTGGGSDDSAGNGGQGSEGSGGDGSGGQGRP